MSHSEPARIGARRLRSAILAALVLVSTTLIGGVTWQAVGPALASSFSTAVGKADGALLGGLTVFDDDTPAVANLDPDLLDALRHAATAAAADRIRIVVNSGWRSRAYQRRLLHEAVSKYGSKGRATRWVATADKSFHVSGDAVDIGPSDAAAWLFEHGALYGLCRIYRNEPWHFELRPEAIDAGCPSMYADPAHDPRMHL
jgi:zinc D-Ala-D-Ala carboxypeptidase